ncbi:MAG: hypothetical protein M5U12_14000 [Verrucomicrobia bacterium]|nr:hypothetical protein [Verrucomicrobiota bacterium]
MTNHPFALEVSALAAGDHVLTALAIDNLGATSAPVELRLRVTHRPAIRWITPVEPAVWDAGTNGTFEMAASDPDGTVVRVEFFRENLEPANWVATITNAPWALVFSNFTAATTFYARAVDNDGVTANTPPLLVQLAGPAGDEFYRPFELSGLHATARASNRAATVQQFENPLLAGASQRTLWWTWTATANGVYHLSTRGSSFDTVLGLFTGANVAALGTVGVNNDELGWPPTSLVKFTGIAGRQYRIAVDGFREAAGDVLLTLALETPLPSPPPNDAFADRAVLAGAEVRLDGSNAAATAESGEPAHAGLAAGASVWFDWTAPTNGTVRARLGPVTFDSVLAVYTITGRRCTPFGRWPATTTTPRAAAEAGRSSTAARARGTSSPSPVTPARPAPSPSNSCKSPPRPDRPRTTLSPAGSPSKAPAGRSRVRTSAPPSNRSSRGWDRRPTGLPSGGAGALPVGAELTSRWSGAASRRASLCSPAPP